MSEGWLNAKTLRKRLSGFINSELGFHPEMSIDDLIKELELAIKTLREMK